jgi:MFS family permease
MSTDGAPRLLSREFLTLGLATMLFFGSMGAVNPLLPKFVVDELHGSTTVVGLVLGSFAVASLSLRSVFGRLAGRRGARLLMLIGAVLGALGMAIFSITSSVPVAILGRLLHGGAMAAIMTGSTVLAIDLAPVERRGEAASYILVSFHFGLGLGPLFGEFVMGRSSYHGVFLALAGLIVASGAVAALLPHRPGHPDAPASPWVHRQGVTPGIIAAFGIVPFVAMSTFVPLYGRQIHLNSVGPVFVVASISIAFARIAFGRVPDRLGPIRSTTIALSLSAAGSAVLAGWATPTGVFVAAAVLAGGMALQTPSLIPAAVVDVAPHERASAMATFTMFSDLSVALTGPILGLIAARASYRMTFLTAGLCALGGLVVLHTYLAPNYRPGAADRSTTGLADLATGVGEM